MKITPLVPAAEPALWAVELTPLVPAAEPALWAVKLTPLVPAVEPALSEVTYDQVTEPSQLATSGEER